MANDRVILVGIDDTDMPDTPGTNQLARALAARVAGGYACVRIVRHQLLSDPRIPCTSKNGSASILLQPKTSEPIDSLTAALRSGVRAWFVPGSDPGLCVLAAEPAAVPRELLEFGRLCQRQIVDQAEALRLAASLGLYLEGLGGTGGGVIGALAAVGLLAGGDDGRVVQIGPWPDDLAGPHNVESLRARGVEVRRLDSGAAVGEGIVDVGKRLRPNVRDGRVVLFVTARGAGPQCWQAVRLP